MYNNEFCTHLQEALNDEILVEKLASADSEAALGEVLSEAGLDLESEDISSIFSQLSEYRNADELTDEMLDQINGGCILCGLAYAGSAIVCAYITYKIGTWIVDRKNRKK